MIKRAVSVKEILAMKFKLIPFEGKYKDSFGTPEMSGVWFVWGGSGNGKTRFLLKLARELSKFGRVAYNTLEEGARRSFQIAIEKSMMPDISNFIILNREEIPDLIERLKKPKSPDIIIIDSWQYAGLNLDGYKKLKAMFPKKLFIIVSHAEGKQPEGRSAKKIQYDADIKMRVEGYKVFVISRYGGGADFIIYEQGAAEYWGIQN